MDDSCPCSTPRDLNHHQNEFEFEELLFKSKLSFEHHHKKIHDDQEEEISSIKKKKKKKKKLMKFGWVSSQLIGGEVEFETPFGKRRLTYADHTASGRCLHYIENYIIKNVLPFYGNTHTSDSYVGRKTTKIVREATEYIKKCLGGGLDDALLFCGSGTTAAVKRLQEVMGISVPSTLRDRILNSDIIKSEERWLVFVGPYEHHSNLLSWRQSLAEVIEIGMDKDGLIDMGELRLKLEFYKSLRRPMLGSFSSCSNVTGIYSDTRAIARLLHQYGAFACFDFACSGPYVEINMRSGDLEGYDTIFLSPHKFLGGPGSPGILLMNKALYELRCSAPSTCGGGTVSYVNGFHEKETLYHDEIEEREDAGTPPIIQKVRAALAFWVKEYIGYDLIETQEKFYIETALKRLLPNPNIWVLGNTNVRRQAILSFIIFSNSTNSSSLDDTLMKSERTNNIDIGSEMRNKTSYEGIRSLDEYLVKPLHGSFVVKLLNDLFGIQARGGCACAAPYGHTLLGVNETISLAVRSSVLKGYSSIKPGWARISFSYYTSKEEFEFILSAIEFIAMYGDRFLPLYLLNWKTGKWTFRMTAMKDTNLGHLRDFIDNFTSPKQQMINRNISEGRVTKFGLYLERAKYIANSLPKSLPKRRVPEGIDHNLVYFKV